MRALLNNRVLGVFRQAVTDLKAAGVQFDRANYGLNTLNSARRNQGVFELQTIYEDPDDTFRIVGDHLTGDPFIVIYLSGTTFPQTYGADVPNHVLRPDGSFNSDCQVGVPEDPDGPRELRYACASIASGQVDDRLVAGAKRYLAAAMKGRAK